MGDTVYQYVQMANAPPTAKFTDASAGQITVMDNIDAAGDVVSVIINDNPLLLERNSATVEVGQSYVRHLPTSSPIIARILFESAEGRMAFMTNVLSQVALIPPALGIPVQPEMIWRDERFEAGIQEDRDAIIEIENAPDVQTKDMLKTPRIRYLASPTVRVNESIIWIDFPETQETIKVHISSVLNATSFLHKFIVPLATATAIINR